MLRLRYINRAQNEWAESFDWPQLYKELQIQASTISGLATLPLPSDFVDLAGFPKVSDGSGTYEYTQVKPWERTKYGASDRYCYLLGATGARKLIFHPGSIYTGASIYVPYQKEPTSLLSPADKPECPNPEFLVWKTLSYLLQGREDDRRLEAETQAARVLNAMIESEAAEGAGSEMRVTTRDEDKYGFRWGEDPR